MHIRPLGLQSIRHLQVPLPDAIAAAPTPAIGSVAAIGSKPASVAAIDSGSLFQNLVSELMRQQALSVTGATDARTSDSFQSFLRALTQSVVPGQRPSTSTSGGSPSAAAARVAGRFGQSGLEDNIRSLIAALGAGKSGAHLAQLTGAFSSLMSELTGSGSAPTGSSLSLRHVLDGMLQNVQRQGSSSSVGQIVDTFA